MESQFAYSSCAGIVWKCCLYWIQAIGLTQDSGGFQLVSLSKFTTITEEGALFASPFTGEPTMLSVGNVYSHPCPCLRVFQPEESISIQHTIGADIIMQLDDVGLWTHSFLCTSKWTYTEQRSVEFNNWAPSWRSNGKIGAMVGSVHCSSWKVWNKGQSEPLRYCSRGIGPRASGSMFGHDGWAER